MTRILGIDPGSRHTGIGVIEHTGNRLHFLGCETISTTSTDIAQRLGEIFRGVTQCVQEFQPDEIGVEKVFMARNADSALKLGQARGAAITAAVQFELPVFEYSARQVKQAVVGQGGADKKQVARMVTSLLKLEKEPQADAADALGIAICHAHMRVGLARMAGSAVRRRRVR